MQIVNTLYRIANIETNIFFILHIKIHLDLSPLKEKKWHYYFRSNEIVNFDLLFMIGT